MAAADSAMADGAAVYLFHADMGEYAIPFINVFKETGWHRSSMIIWAKQCASMGWQDYRQQHECCSYGWKGKNHYFTDDRSQTTLWQIDREGNYLHPTQKPPELAARALQNSTKAGDVVLDAFCGAGFTLVACEQLGRKGRGIEICEKYCAVTLQRLADMGLKPERIK